MDKMKILFALLLLSSLFLAGCSSEAAEQDSSTTTTIKEQGFCPRGVTDDPYPGMCIRYVDQNKDGFCDNGE